MDVRIKAAGQAGLVVLAIGLGSQARGAEIPLPDFDVGPYCQIAVAGSEGVYARNRCRSDEARSWNAVRFNWDRLPDAARITCTSIARSNGRSFFILEACLKSYAAANWMELGEVSAAADRAQLIGRSFKR